MGWINEYLLVVTIDEWVQFLLSLNLKGVGFYLHVHLSLFCESNLTIPYQQTLGSPEFCSFSA